MGEVQYFFRTRDGIGDPLRVHKAFPLMVEDGLQRNGVEVELRIAVHNEVILRNVKFLNAIITY